MKILSIGLNTFRENLRDKLLYNLLVFALLMIGSSVILSRLTLGEFHRLILDLGLGSINFFTNNAAVAEGWYLQSLELHRSAENRTMEAWSLHMLGLSILGQRRFTEGLEVVRHALRHFVPRMPKGAVLAFDELDNPMWPGETLAALDEVGLGRLQLRRFEWDPYIAYAILD